MWTNVTHSTQLKLGWLVEILGGNDVDVLAINSLQQFVYYVTVLEITFYIFYLNCKFKASDKTPAPLCLTDR